MFWKLPPFEKGGLGGFALALKQARITLIKTAAVFVIIGAFYLTGLV